MDPRSGLTVRLVRAGRRLPAQAHAALRASLSLARRAAPPSCPDVVTSRRRGPGPSLAIASVLAAMALVVIDAGIANLALPTIADALQVTPARSIWIVTAYQAALLMALLPLAALGESLGYRRVFTGGVALFTGASVLCALAPSLPWLVGARFLQGLGSAAVMALGLALLRNAVAPEQLGAAIGWNALVVALSSAVGPAIGAAVLSAASWRWIFVVNLPLGALVLLGSRVLPAGGGTARRPDLGSVALHAGAFAAFVIAADLLPARPALAVTMFAAAAYAVLTLVKREMPKQAPLIPLDLLRAGAFRVSAIASVFCFAGQTAGMLALPFYLQHALAQDTLTAGLYMTPWPLSVAIAAPFAGRLASRVPAARLCAVGGLCLAAGLGAIACWPLHGALLPLIPLTMLCGAGFGLFNVANNRSMFMVAPAARSGAAGGLQGTARLLGQTTGAVLMTLLYTMTSAATAPRAGLAVGSALTLAAALASLQKPDDPASG